MEQKTERIIHELIKQGINPPKKDKINYILRKIRKGKKVTDQPTFNDVLTWCEKYQEILENENEVFVGLFEL